MRKQLIRELWLPVKTRKEAQDLYEAIKARCTLDQNKTNMYCYEYVLKKLHVESNTYYIILACNGLDLYLTTPLPHKVIEGYLKSAYKTDVDIYVKV